MSGDRATGGLGDVLVQEARHSLPWAVVCIAGWTIVGASIPLFGRHPVLTAGLALASWSVLVGVVVAVRSILGIERAILESSRRIVWLSSVLLFGGFVVLLSVVVFRMPAVVLVLYGVVSGIGIYVFGG